MMNKRKILITGGTGKTGIRIAKRLNQQGYSYTITMRNAEAITAPENQVHFNWYDSSTFLLLCIMLNEFIWLHQWATQNPLKL